MSIKEVFEVKNFLMGDEISFIDSEILSDHVPWHYDKISTSERFPFFKHTIITRAETESSVTEIVSPLHDFFTNIQIRFCETYDINIKKIYRQCLNLTFPCEDFEHGDPHVDHNFKHKNMIIYLNDDYEMGETLFFNKHGKIIGEVKPEKGKIVCFDGSIFHSIKWIPKGRRIVFVSTFI